MITVEVQYREVVDGAPGAWFALAPVPDGSTAETPALRIGGIYESRARRVDAFRGIASAWVPVGEGEIGYSNPPPAAVRNLRVVCGESLTWDPAVEGEVSATRFRVLHAPAEWRHYQDMSEAVEGTTGLPPFDLCLVPRGRRTLCVVPVDDEGQEGAPAYLTIDRGPFDDAEPVTGRLEEKGPAFSDSAMTLTGGAVSGGAVVATAASSGDAGPFYIGEDEQVFYNGADAAAFYADSYLEMTVDLRYHAGSTNGRYDITDDHAVLTLPVTIAAGENWKAFYRPQPSPFYRTTDDTPIDEDAFYHGDGTDSKFWHGVDDLDPFWGADTDELYIGEDTDPFYDEFPWLPWPGRLASLEPQELDLRILFPEQTTRASVTAFAPHESLVPRMDVDVPALGATGLIDTANLSGGLLPAGERMERGLAVVSPSTGPTTVTFATPFSDRPTVTVGIEDAGGDEFSWQFTAGGPTTTGFSVRVYDAAGTEVFTGRIHWLAVGKE